MKKMVLLMLCAVIALAANTPAEVQIPYAFKAGEAAKAAEVNANFKALQDALEQLQTVVTELEAQNGSLAKENQALKTTIVDLQAQIGELKKQLAALQKQSVAAATPTPIPAAKGPRLRSKPVTVSDNEAQQQFNVDVNGRPRQYIKNDFEDQGDFVIDHATGLTWQKSGSPDAMTYREAQIYIEKFNRDRFAGYSDWRLPTVNELFSLMEQDTQSYGFYIDPLFDITQTWCWSADKDSSGNAWRVDFKNGDVYWSNLASNYYVRAVRP